MDTDLVRATGVVRFPGAQTPVVRGEPVVGPNSAAQTQLLGVMQSSIINQLSRLNNAGTVGATQNLNDKLTATSVPMGGTPAGGGGTAVGLDTSPLVGTVAAPSQPKSGRVARWQAQHPRADLFFRFIMPTVGAYMFAKGDHLAGGVLVAAGGVLWLNRLEGINV